MRYVYLLRSESDPQKTYISSTNGLGARVAAHNRGESPHTTRSLPWRLVTAISFQDDRKAVDFEAYLKTGSGRAFAKRHLW